MKNISILGSTGSIGTQTLEVCDLTNEYRVCALTANTDVKKMEEQIRRYKPDIACLAVEECAADLKIRVKDTNTRILSGFDGICECAAYAKTETVIAAIVGIAGLKPTLSAIREGKRIALANKETLVTAGHIVNNELKKYDAELIPVDSEHSAIFQSISNQRKFLNKIIITASGGPFFGKSRDYLKNITPDEALKHPNWDMGAKITIDSATLVNKGLEIIEAMHLFNVDADSIVPVIHRESIVHSLVEFCDGSVIAQLGLPDMKLPIQYALSYPERTAKVCNTLDLAKISKLTFFDVDNDVFPAITLAKKAVKMGGVACAVYNGANEAAVELFLKGKCGFIEITDKIQNALEKCPKILAPCLEDIFEADSFARKIVKESD